MRTHTHTYMVHEHCTYMVISEKQRERGGAELLLSVVRLGASLVHCCYLIGAQSGEAPMKESHTSAYPIEVQAVCVILSQD